MEKKLNDGTVKIRFSNNICLPDSHSLSSRRLTRSNSSYISPMDYIVHEPSRASTSHIKESFRCDNIKIDRDNIAQAVPDLTESELDFPDGLTQ